MGLAKMTTTQATNVRENGLPVYKTADGRMWVQSLMRETGDSRAMWMRVLVGGDLGHSALIACEQLHETGARWFIPHCAPGGEVRDRRITYKYLWCWDLMMHSGAVWMADRQAQAAQDKAPLDAIYKGATDNRWHTMGELQNADTFRLIDQHMRTIFGVPA